MDFYSSVQLDYTINLFIKKIISLSLAAGLVVLTACAGETPLALSQREEVPQTVERRRRI